MKESRTSRILSAALCVVCLCVFLCTAAPTTRAQAPSTQERVIIKPGLMETRVPVGDTTMYPFSAIVRVVATFSNGEKAIGSGAFIGPNRVVTAGHLVYDHSLGYAKQIEIAPGYNNGNAPFGITYASYMETTKGYMNAGDPNFDFAMLRTYDPLGWRTGWLGFKPTDSQDLNQVWLGGYPNDLGGTRRMYFVGGQSSWENSHRLQYQFWTDGGMSGGPLFNNFFYVVGIHTGGGSDYNYGVSIDPVWLRW